MRDLLDANIIGGDRQARPSQSRLAWMSEQNDEDLFIASLTVAEIRLGVLEKPAGTRRDQLEALVLRAAGPAGVVRRPRAPLRRERRADPRPA